MHSVGSRFGGGGYNQSGAGGYRDRYTTCCVDNGSSVTTNQTITIGAVVALVVRVSTNGSGGIQLLVSTITSTGWR
jgi:hypothetical protein